MKAIKYLSIGCLGLLVIMTAIAIILWRGSTGLGFLDSAINAQKRTIIAEQCVERAKLPHSQCDCMAGELAILPMSDVISAIQSAQSGNPDNMSGELQKHGDLLSTTLKKCGFDTEKSQSGDAEKSES